MTWALSLLLACAVCAERPTSSAGLIALAVFIALPFGVAALVFRAVRKAGS
ncbi:MAG TPA: hypothetical protein VG496_06050 [Myxococcales bacterium]|nr:hypothetical protein [Myxococcales bacterium]